jgi:hypothetical protein
MTSEQAKKTVRQHLVETTKTLESRFVAHHCTFKRHRDRDLLKKELARDRAYFLQRLAEANRLKGKLLDHRMARIFDKGRIQNLQTHFEAHEYCLNKLLTVQKPEKMSPPEKAVQKMAKRWDALKAEHRKRLSKIDPKLSRLVFKARIETHREIVRREVKKFRAEALVRANESQYNLPVEAQEYLVAQNLLLDRALSEHKAGLLKPPEYEFVGVKDLPSGALKQVSFYPDGQLKRVTAGWGTLTLQYGVPSARYEDSANVTEYSPSGIIEQYGGRYHHVERAKMSFRDWVRTTVEHMLTG